MIISSGNTILYLNKYKYLVFIFYFFLIQYLYLFIYKMYISTLVVRLFDYLTKC